MSLTTPLSVQKLQTALHDKAKGSPKFRFYAVYDKVYREDVMAFAYDCCKANRGAAGVDGQTFEDIEEYGLKKWLDELTQELKSRTYQPQPVRRVYIPKPDGKQRPLGVPAIKDRVAQTAAVLVLEPIFEADLQPEQYAYRADRSALDAVKHVHKLLNTGHKQIVDADLSGYFDSIPHSDLLKSVARRIVDGASVVLYRFWSIAPVSIRAIWIIILSSTLFSSVYQFLGEEIIEIDSQKLTIRKGIHGWERTREYQINECSNFEWNPGRKGGSYLTCKAGRWPIKENDAGEIMSALQEALPDVAQKICPYPGSKEHFITLGLNRP
jgi:Reverse transcriptase (RNA-dependent DNA polymerase)